MHISKKTHRGFQAHKVRTKLGLQMRECLPEKGTLKWDRKKEVARCKDGMSSCTCVLWGREAVQEAGTDQMKRP